MSFSAGLVAQVEELWKRYPHKKAHQDANMKTLWTVVLRNFLPVFLLAIVFFVLILELADLFTNLWNFLNNDVGYAMIALTQLYYLPKCISYALPVALLLSVYPTLTLQTRKSAYIPNALCTSPLIPHQKAS